MNERLKELARQAKPSPNLIWEDAELEHFADLVRQDYLRELKALKPVGYMDSRGVLFNKTTHPQLNTPLYALDEVTK
jgi:hypothetical protein